MQKKSRSCLRLFLRSDSPDDFDPLPNLVGVVAKQPTFGECNYPVVLLLPNLVFVIAKVS
jgi:hypothetical protein